MTFTHPQLLTIAPILDRSPEPVTPALAADLQTFSDVDEAVAAWAELAEALEQTPLFPVEEFAQILRYLTPVLVDQPRWDAMIDAVDAAVVRSSGGAAAGAGCRDRALALRDAGRTRKSLHEMHRAKVEWWSGEALRGALLSMLLIAENYNELGVPFAAKQYALAVAGAAQVQGDDDLTDLVAAGMLHAALCSYRAGDWMASLEETEIGLLALHALNDDEDPRSGELLQNAMLTYAFVLRAARDLVPDVQSAVEELGDRFDIRAGVDEALEGADPWSSDDWRTMADEQLLGRPFSDVGATYESRFSALGTHWTLRSANEYASVRATQRLAAAAQILLVELAEDDLCLMPSTIDVSVELLDGVGVDTWDRAEAQPSNERREWVVRLTPARPGKPMDQEHSFQELLVILGRLLLDVSLVPCPPIPVHLTSGLPA